MKLPVPPPVLPMLAKRVSELPQGGDFLFEPKWDGFRALIFRDGAELLIQSRDEKPLNRYFPEVERALLAQLPQRCVLDGEIVVPQGDRLDFDVLQMRLHPAASRVKMLSETTPASMVFWDVLCIGDEDLRQTPLRERKSRLQALLEGLTPPLHLTPETEDRSVAEDWFHRFEGAGLDGVMAKPLAGTYQPNKRVLFKVKHERTCDCVVAGFRWHKNGKGTRIGSLLLGLFDDAGQLQHVGVTASFTEAKSRELLEELQSLRENAFETHPWRAWAEGSEASAQKRMPGGQSRWSQGKDLSWEPLRLERVVEVAYDHMQGNRFRHTGQFRRWRPDKPPQQCTYEQLETVPAFELARIFASDEGR